VHYTRGLVEYHVQLDRFAVRRSRRLLLHIYSDYWRLLSHSRNTGCCGSLAAAERLDGDIGGELVKVEFSYVPQTKRSSTATESKGAIPNANQTAKSNITGNRV